MFSLIQNNQKTAVKLATPPELNTLITVFSLTHY